MNNKKGLNLRYDFSIYNGLVKDYLRSVYIKSMDFYKNKYCKGNPTGTEKLDLDTIENSIGYLEDYLYYYYRFYNDKFNYIFNTLKKNVKKISVLDKKDRGIYGLFIPFVGIIYLNPELGPSDTLNKDERTRLYFCHELGHAVNHEWINSFSHHVNCSNNSVGEMTYNGFNLIDEATAQNMAENIAYFYSNSRRPRKKLYRGSLFSGKTYKTNFDFYGNLQESATMFSKTLRGIGSIDDDDEALNRLSVRALDKDFLKDVVYEYKRDGHMEDFYYLMSYLGIIKRASYATFGYDDIKYISSSLDALTELTKLASSLRDYRPPFRR